MVDEIPLSSGTNFPAENHQSFIRSDDMTSILAQFKVILDEENARSRAQLNEYITEQFEILERQQRLRNMERLTREQNISNLQSNQLPERRSNYEITKDDRYIIKEIAEIVPRYDGNSYRFRQCIRACRDAQDMIPLRLEYELVQAVLLKISGRARAALEYIDCYTMSDLIYHISIELGPCRNLSDYYVELRGLRLDPNEDMLDYLSRAKDLHEDMLMAERREQRTPLSPEIIYRLDKTTIRALIYCFPPGLRNLPKPEQFQTLQEAYIKIKELIHVWKRDTRVFDISDYKHIYDVTQHNTQCEYSQYDTQREFQRKSQRPIQNKSAYDPNKYCTHCKRPGHIYNECRRRSRNYNPNNSEQHVHRPNDSCDSGNEIPPVIAYTESRGIQPATQPQNQTLISPTIIVEQPPASIGALNTINNVNKEVADSANFSPPRSEASRQGTKFPLNVSRLHAEERYGEEELDVFYISNLFSDNLNCKNNINANMTYGNRIPALSSHTWKNQHYSNDKAANDDSPDDEASSINETESRVSNAMGTLNKNRKRKRRNKSIKASKLIFTAGKGNPIDVGRKYGQFSTFNNNYTEQISIKRGNHKTIRLITRTNASDKVQKEITQNGFKLLPDLIAEKKLKILPINKNPT